MKLVRFSALISIVFLTVGAGGVAPLRDFTPQSAMLERGYETTFLDIPSAQGALNHATYLNGHAHYPGSWGDRDLAIYMRDRLREYGFDANLEGFTARVDTPLLLRLELDTKPKQNLDLTEASMPQDADVSRPDAGVPFNYGSGDGNVTAPLVYANRGLDDDYATLASANVPVRGRIVLVRYGAQFRGLLARRAQDRGAAGIIFYSDPKDDGAGRGPAYPNGPYRPAGSVQRGSVGSVRIPTLPITSINAAQLLSDMSGAGAPAAWNGALNAPYVLGATRHDVHLYVVMKRTTQTIWNTIGTLTGSTPRQSVILGGHRDAWVYGVTDNGSGISTLLETARGLGYLHKSGWVPKRTIIIAGWDAEEIGELGSTNYVQVHQNELRAGCIAYINADENVSGSLFAADAAAALATDVVGATTGVHDPQRVQISLFDRWLETSRRSTRDRLLSEPVVSTPGGGSDHEPFLFKLGIPTAQAGFNGPLGVYHSAYDDLKYATTIVDPGFTLHRTMSQLLGILAMRLADADAVPYRFAPYAPALREGAAALEARARVTGASVSVRPLRMAIERFARAAHTYDGRRANPSADSAAPLKAVQLLDMTAYGATGYASTAFPQVSAALDGRNAAAIAAAFAGAASAVDRAASLLR